MISEVFCFLIGLISGMWIIALIKNNLVKDEPKTTTKFI